MRLLFGEKDKQSPCLLWFEKQIASARCLFRRRGTAIYVATVLLAKKAQKKEGAEAPSQILRFNFANFRFLAGKRKTSCRSYLELNVAFFCGCCDNINREELLNFYNGLCVNFFHYERPPFSLLIRQSRSPADFMLKLN